MIFSAYSTFCVQRALFMCVCMCSPAKSSVECWLFLLDAFPVWRLKKMFEVFFIYLKHPSKIFRSMRFHCCLHVPSIFPLQCKCILRSADFIFTAVMKLLGKITMLLFTKKAILPLFTHTYGVPSQYVLSYLLLKNCCPTRNIK